MAEEESAAAEIREKLAQLRELRDQLDAVDVALNDLVPEVEKMFDSLRLGVDIWMTMRERDDGIDYLSFEKVNKRRRLCQVTGSPNGDPDDYTIVPISDLSRDKRAEILGYHVPRLLDSAVDQLKRRIEDRRGVIDSTNELIETVGDFVTRGEEAPKEQPLSLLHQAALGLATSAGKAPARAASVTFDPPLGQPLPALTLPGELPGPPAVPVKPINPFYDLASNVVPSGPVYTKIVVDGTKTKRGKFPKPGTKL